MVIIKNIVKTKDCISADYYPDGIDKKGFMKIRLADKQVIEHENANLMAAAHVKIRLRELAEMNDFPSEDLVMWY